MSSRCTYDAFLSYSRSDNEELVRYVYEVLTAKGFKIWWDRVCMPQRAVAFTDEIRFAILDSERIIPFIGITAPKSEYVVAEWDCARDNGLAIHPILCAGDPLDKSRFSISPSRFSDMNIIDFTYPVGSDRFSQEMDLLMTNLGSELPPLGRLYGLPKLPEGYIYREDKVRELKKKISSSESDFIKTKPVSMISGMAGIGKSVLANSICHEGDVRRTFPDGIIWINITRNYDIRGIWNRVCSSLEIRDDAPSDADFDVKLENIFRDRRCLIVLDDVWDEKIISIFSNAISDTDTKALITVRDKDVGLKYCFDPGYVGVMSREESQQLLCKYSGSQKCELDVHSKKLLEAVDNLPIAIAMFGSMHRDGKSWENILKRFMKIGGKTDCSLTGYQHNNISSAIQLSVDCLSDTLAPLYRSLGVFPRSVDIPLHAIEVLWSKYGYEDWEDEDFIIDLENKALLTYDRKEKFVRLHDLQSDYLREMMEDTTGSHTEFVSAYRNITKEDWVNGPNDGYYFQRIVYHMILSERDIAKTMKLMTSAEWLFKKLSVAGIESINHDFETLMEHTDVPDSISVISKGIELSTPILLNTPDQLPQQMWGRLSNSHDSEIDAFLDDIKGRTRIGWVRPVFPSQASPLPRIPIYIPVDRDEVTPTICGDRMYVNNRNGEISEWDAITGKDLRTTDTGLSKIAKLFLEGDLIIAVSEEGDIVPVDRISMNVQSRHSIGIKTLHSIHLADGHIACGTLDGRVVTWSPTDGSIAISDKLAEGKIECIVGLGNGEVVCGGNDGSVYIYDHKHRMVIRTLVGHTDHLTSLEWFPPQIYSGSWDRTVRSWDSEGNPLRTYVGHTGSIVSIAKKEDTLYTASWDSHIRAWDINSGMCIAVLRGHSGAVTCIRIADDFLYSCSLDGTIRKWDLEQNKCIHTSNRINDGLLQITVCGDRLYSTDNARSVSCFSTSSLNCLWHNTTFKHKGLFLERCSDRAVSCSFNGIVQFWDERTLDNVKIETGTFVKDTCATADRLIMLDQTSGIHMVSSDGDRKDYGFNDDFQTICCNDKYVCAASDRCICLFDHDMVPIKKIDIAGSPMISDMDGSRIVISHDDRLEMYSVPDLECIGSCNYDRAAVLLLIPDGLLVGSKTGMFGLFSKDISEKRWEKMASNESISGIDVLGTDYVTSSISGFIKVWSDSGKLEADYQKGGPIYDVTVLGDTIFALTTGRNRILVAKYERPQL